MSDSLSSELSILETTVFLQYIKRQIKTGAKILWGYKFRGNFSLLIFLLDSDLSGRKLRTWSTDEDNLSLPFTSEAAALCCISLILGERGRGGTGAGEGGWGVLMTVGGAGEGGWGVLRAGGLERSENEGIFRWMTVECEER